jgi:hypothetical protein
MLKAGQKSQVVDTIENIASKIVKDLYSRIEEHQFVMMKGLCLAFWYGRALEEIKERIDEAGKKKSIQTLLSKEKQALVEKLEADVKEKLQREISECGPSNHLDWMEEMVDVCFENKMDQDQEDGEAASSVEQENKKLKVGIYRFAELEPIFLVWLRPRVPVC